MTHDRGDMEHRIEEAFMRHSGDVEPEPGAWEGVQSGVRRAHRTRVALSSAAAVALIAAGIFVVPKLVNRDGPSTGPITNPSQTQSPSVLPSEPATNLEDGWSVLRYDEQGYWFALPDTWKTGWFEGHAEYRPPGLPGLASGEDTFAVETFSSQGVAEPDGTPDTFTINGMTTKRWDESKGSGPYSLVFRIHVACEPGDGCTAPPLQVVIYGSTEELWREHMATGNKMVAALHRGDDPTPAEATTYRTFNGTSSVAWDAKTQTVVEFMQSRIFGDTARGDRVLTANAQKQYADHDGGLDRYDPDSSRRMVTYHITGREGVDANSVEFTVRITEQSLDGSKPPSTYTETLGVGPGDGGPDDNALQIRFARRDNG